MKNETEILTEDDFENFPQKTESFGIAIGEYFAAIVAFMSLYGISNNHISPITIPSDLNITHNNFHSKKLYKRIASQAILKVENIAPILFFTLTQVNIHFTSSFITARFKPSIKNSIFDRFSCDTLFARNSKYY